MLRIAAGLNALFVLVVGALAVIAPHVAASLFHIVIPPSPFGPSMLALIRMFGGAYLGLSWLSIAVAKRPSDLTLRRLFAASLVANLLADAVLVSRGELPFSTLASGVILQLLVLSVVLTQRNAT
jgi:hypothetical protein